MEIIFIKAMCQLDYETPVIAITVSRVFQKLMLQGIYSSYLLFLYLELFRIGDIF